MALQQWLAWVHAGAGTDDEKKVIKLPDNLYVAFYVPPGRQLGKDFGMHVFNELHPSLKMTTLEEIDAFHQQLRGQIKSVPRGGNTKPWELNLHAELDFKDWPRILGKGYVEDCPYLLNYEMFGANADDIRKSKTAKQDYAMQMGVYHLGSGLVRQYNSTQVRSSLKIALEKIANKTTGGDTAILHFLACREESSDAGIFADPDSTDTRQQIQLT